MKDLCVTCKHCKTIKIIDGTIKLVDCKAYDLLVPITKTCNKYTKG